MKKQYQGWFGAFELDPDIDFYGDGYWLKVAKKTYEPDTMVFLENNIDSNTDFIDIGAATGAMSLIAASLGANVLAFEAIPRVYSIATAHFSNNPGLYGKIRIQNKAISNVEGILELGRNANSKIISSISNEETNQKVEIAALANVIGEIYQNDRKLVLKIDIEGAEWQLLSDNTTLTKLNNSQAIVLLAIHPGFHRPFKKLPLGLTCITKKIWQVQNLLTTYFFFRKLLKMANITRTSLDKIKSPKKCVLLMFGGYFEFILNFGQQG